MAAALLLLLATVQEVPYRAPPIPDPELAQQRGGFRLPNGVEVSMRVQTDTAVNGALVLRTVFAADQGRPTVTVYVPKPGEKVPGGGVSAGAGNVASMPTVTYDARNGIQVTPGVTTIAARTITGSLTAEAQPAGLVEAGAGAVTDNGTIAEGSNGLARTVTLQGPDLSVTHLVGNALGSAIANSGSNRTIDTQTSVAINLHGAGPDVVGSSMLRAQDVAEGALQGRLSR